MGDFVSSVGQGLSPLPATVVFGLAVGALISIYVFYQLVLHPLARYPGPFLAKFSMVRAGYHAWKGDSHIDIWQLHRKYGPIVRYGPNWILFNSEQGYKDIYGVKQNTGKHHHFSQFNPRAANLFTIHDKKVHSQRRRCIGKSFSDAGIQKFEWKLIDHINRFCNQIDALHGINGGGWSEPLKMSDWMGYFIFDTLTDFVLNQDYNLLQSNKDRPIIQHIQQHIIRPAVCTYMPFLALLKFDKILFKRATNSTRAFWRWIKSAITERKQQLDGAADVFSQIQLSRQAETSPIGIQSETGMLIVAGLDTTTAALCSLLFYLSRSQQSYERLCSEIRHTFEKEGHIRLGRQLKSCTFLHACIDEALRMSPPVGSPPWREVGPGGEIIVGEVIPQGCSVGTGIYSMHHNDAYFQSPHKFIPERWLPQLNTEGIEEKTYKPVFMPFSSGPRSCIGRSLAYAEVSLTIAILVWRYDFKASSGPQKNVGGLKAFQTKEGIGRANPLEFQLVDQVVGHPEGPMLEFRRRSALQT